MGQPVRRPEDPRLLKGQGRYATDIVLTGMLHMAVLRSPHAHARILATDFSAARRLPGVAMVVGTGDLKSLELPVLGQPQGQRQLAYPVLPVEKVLYAGQPVAAVVAASRYLAEDAIEMIRVEYEELPPVTDPDEAMAPNAPRLYEQWPDNLVVWRDVLTGEPDRAFAAAHLVVEATFALPRQTASPLEGKAACAAFDPDTGELTLWVSNQAPHQYRTVLAAALNLDENKIHVVVPDVGGGFGAKLHYYPEELLACVAAMRLGRAVKWVEDRREHFLGMVHAREQRVRARAAFDREGRLLALDAHVRGDVGAHLHTKGAAPIFVTGLMLPGPYDVPNYRARIEAVVTNKVPFGAYRAFGMQQSTFVIERLMDMGAERLGLDPAEIRRRNLIRPEALPYKNGGGFVYDSGNYPHALERVLERAGYRELRELQERRRAEGRLVGIGLCTYVEFTGMGPAKWMAAVGNRQGGYEPAVVRLDPSGQATVLSGIIELGQGIRAAFAQIAADVLGLSPDRVRVVLGDTDLCPYSSYGTAASRGSVVGGGAVVEASRGLRKKVAKMAAHLLEAGEEDIELADGRCYVRGVPTRGLSLAEVAREAYRGQNLPPGAEPALESRVIYQPENFAFTYGAHVVAVEVDRELGSVTFLGYWIVHDCGTVINPMLVDGQLLGGVAQGIGAALLEELVYDAAGQLLSGTFVDYLLPTAVDVPGLNLDHLETPSPTTPGGIKGMAEGGLIAAPAAVANAIADALGGAGRAITFYPLSPQRLVRLMAEARSREG
jgi:carbon-monoxide dehydrogenase large subunit